MSLGDMNFIKGEQPDFLCATNAKAYAIQGHPGVCTKVKFVQDMVCNFRWRNVLARGNTVNDTHSGIFEHPHKDPIGVLCCPNPGGFK